MTCKHADYGNDTVAEYAAGPEKQLLVILREFNNPNWAKLYRGHHLLQAYRRKFFKLARERGIDWTEDLGS